MLVEREREKKKREWLIRQVTVNIILLVKVMVMSVDWDLWSLGDCQGGGLRRYWKSLLRQRVAT